MKPVIAALSAVLLILLVLWGALWIADSRSSPAAQPSVAASTQPPRTETTRPSTSETTEATTEPTEPTEPAPVLAELEQPIVLEGVRLSCRSVNGSGVYVTAEEFAQAVGLSYEDADGAITLQGYDTVATDGKQLTVNGQPLTDARAYLADGTLYLPVDALSAALEYPTYTDEETGLTYITPTARPFDIPQGVNVPVLMYHAVSDYLWGIGELFVSPSDMEAQLAYLVENGYDPIWFSDLAHLAEYDKPVILTFDDGYDDNYTELFPLLQKYQVKATVFIIGNAPGTSHKMTEEQIREMSESGLVSIQSHGYTHNDMNWMDEDTLEFELGETKRLLTRITGKIPYVLCYPTGYYSDLTLEVAARYYLFGLKMNGKQYNTSDDPFLVNRYYISRYTDLATFASYLELSGTSS